MITRRTFVAGAAAALAAAPRFTLAQATKKRRIAVLHIRRPIVELTEAGGVPIFVAFYQGLRERGYIVGENLEVDLWSNPDPEQLSRDVVASAPEVIYSQNFPIIGPFLMVLTQTIPIVFTASDPVGRGLVSNLARPGGNVTGMASTTGVGLVAKRLQLLVEAVPTVKRVGYLGPRRVWEAAEGVLRSAASVLGVTLVPVFFDEPVEENDIRRAFADLTDKGVEAYVRGRGQQNARVQLFADLALERRLPAIAPNPEFPRLGGLMSYGANLPDLTRRAGGYVARILDGEYPGDLPVQQPTEFDFIINLKTARELGITLPPALMIQAAEFIE